MSIKSDDRKTANDMFLGITNISATISMCFIEDIQIFGMNMPFISSSEAKNAYFMSGEATNEIFIFSLHEMK